MSKFKNNRTLMGVTTKNKKLYGLLCCLEDLNYEADKGVCVLDHVQYRPFKLHSRRSAPEYPSRILVAHDLRGDSFKIFTEPNTLQTENLMRFVDEKMSAHDTSF